MSMKPEYRIPSMAEIRAQPRNGLFVVSTFSGCGGSCLGFKMAGYSALWASEFIPAARETYAKNFPDVPVDDRDIRKVQPEEILKAIGRERGDIDVLEGSPPCASFSMAGKRQAHWGESKKYSDTEQRVDDLFFEYVRLVRGLRPRVIVAENVKGLTVGKAKGYYLEIKQALTDAGYRIRAKVLDAQWLGVPQHRERLIFVGVREDLDVDPVFPKPFKYRYAIRDALPHVSSFTIKKRFGEDQRFFGRDVAPTVDTCGMSAKNFYHLEVEDLSIERFAIGKEWKKLRQGEQSEKYFQLVRPDPTRPCPTVTQTAGNVGAAGITHPSEPRKFTIPELKRLCSFPDDFELTGSYAQQWERCGRAVPPLMMKAVAETIAREVFHV